MNVKKKARHFGYRCQVSQGYIAATALKRLLIIKINYSTGIYYRYYYYMILKTFSLFHSLKATLLLHVEHKGLASESF